MNNSASPEPLANSAMPYTAGVRKRASSLALLRPLSLEHRNAYIESIHGNLIRRYAKTSKRARKQAAVAARKAA